MEHVAHIPSSERVVERLWSGPECLSNTVEESYSRLYDFCLEDSEVKLIPNKLVNLLQNTLLDAEACV